MKRASSVVPKIVRRLGLLAALSAGITAAVVLSARADHDAPAGHAGHAPPSARPGSATAMTDAQMQEGIRAWFARRPMKLGAPPLAAQGGFGDTVVAFSSSFDSGEPGTIDTAFVFAGESVLWRLSSGFHTVTNGEDSSDPNAGLEYNAPLDSGNPTFSHTFNTAGVYPFFCVIHEFFPMKGYVRVRATTEVAPIGPPGGRVGFVAPPTPNPSRSGFSFRFALREHGRVRGEVVDAAGRSVSRVLDRELEPGVYAGSWDGRRRDGAAARAGVYWVRIEGPGFRESRKVVVQR